MWLRFIKCVRTHISGNGFKPAATAGPPIGSSPAASESRCLVALGPRPAARSPQPRGSDSHRSDISLSVSHLQSTGGSAAQRPAAAPASLSPPAAASTHFPPVGPPAPAPAPRARQDWEGCALHPDPFPPVLGPLLPAHSWDQLCLLHESLPFLLGPVGLHQTVTALEHPNSGPRNEGVKMYTQTADYSAAMRHGTAMSTTRRVRVPC